MSWREEIYYPGTKGDCYRAAFKYFHYLEINNVNRVALVHGNISTLRQDQEVNHAWVEENDLVHDVSGGNHITVSKSKFYARDEVEIIRRYSLYESNFNAAMHEHFGPWPEEVI